MSLGRRAVGPGAAERVRAAGDHAPAPGRRESVELVPHAPQLTSFGRRDRGPDDKILERAHRGHAP